MSLLKLLPLTLIVSCGASDKPQPTPSPSLESEVARIQPMLSECEGWYSRPNCDMGERIAVYGPRELGDVELNPKVAEETKRMKELRKQMDKAFLNAGLPRSK